MKYCTDKTKVIELYRHVWIFYGVSLVIWPHRAINLLKINIFLAVAVAHLHLLAHLQADLARLTTK